MPHSTATGLRQTQQYSTNYLLYNQHHAPSPDKDEHGQIEFKEGVAEGILDNTISSHNGATRSDMRSLRKGTEGILDTAQPSATESEAREEVDSWMDNFPGILDSLPISSSHQEQNTNSGARDVVSSYEEYHSRSTATKQMH